MADRRRTPRLAAALALCLLAIGLLGGRAWSQVGPQDPTTTAAFGTTAPAGATATTAAGGSDAATTQATDGSDASDGSDQTIISAPPPASKRLATESRKVKAIVAALVVVAIALAILTIRYWRATKPLLEAETTTIADAAQAVAVPEAAPAADPLADPVPAAAVAAAAPRGVDPVPTDEHERIEVPARVVRPSSAARRAALGISS
ncbi:MAG: hypothetical protein U0P45_14830 [Acidimicrobiales bacterium]